MSDKSSLMRVARLHGAHDMRVHDEPVPTVGADESLVRVTAVGICGSDLHWFTAAGIGDAHLKRALVLGHEFAGILETTGQHVAIDPLLACGRCELCRQGKPNLCLAQRFAGHGEEDGALREYIAWRAAGLIPLPDELSDEEGAMLEPLGVAIHAVRLANLQPAMTVGVFGCGPIGLLIAQVARVEGAARIMATEKLAHRLDAAESFGAEVFVADGAEADAILAATNQSGVDIAFEAAGEQSAVDAACAAVKPGGRVILAGIPDNNLTSLTASIARRKELILQFVRRMRDTYPRAMELVARGQVDVRSLVTHRFPLEHISEAFAVAHRREGIKVLVKC